MDLGTGGLYRRRRLVRAREAHDLVTGIDELANDGGTDEARGASDKNTHERPPEEVMSVSVITLALMSEAVIN